MAKAAAKSGHRKPTAEAAARLADVAILTSDNPRSEDPLRILAEMLDGVLAVSPHQRAHVIIEPDRAAAIDLAVAGLLALYDKDHDLRFRYHMVEGYSYDRGMINPGFDHPGYTFFFKDRIPSGPTVAEMILVKAECLARTGQRADAMAAVNQLRARRMEPGAWVNLTAASDDDAIAKVLQERRREMPFTQRWFDIRRYNNNNYPNDDVELSREFYPFTISSVQSDQPVQTYTLPKNSRRFAAPVPRTEMISSNGVITQNTY